jgi:hypothetical protein
MEKQVLFFGATDAGVFAQPLFGSAGAFEKTAGAAPFSDWETGEALRGYIQKITPEDRKQYVYVLVNALGAGEYFGPNINADYFPWEALAHQGKDYGYQTFLNAHAFQHHANKDPARAFGIPVLSVLNRGMKRVELVIRLDREQARAQGADPVIARIERGEFPDVSMGCKVPFDVCSICGHKSKTRDDYCQHMRPPEEMRGIFGPNRILSDGRKIYVVNTLPRFFDISFVFIGADKTAKVMAKLAQKGAHLCLGNVCAMPARTAGPAEGATPHLYGPSGEELKKVASPCEDGRRGPCGRLCATCPEENSCSMNKLAEAFGQKTAAKKIAEIMKKIPLDGKSMRTLEEAEPDIMGRDLDHLSTFPFPAVLGSATRLGMVLKPHEFQHLVLKRMGEEELLSQLERGRHVFRQVPDFDYGGMPTKLDSVDSVFELLKKYVRDRTALGTNVSIRLVVSAGDAKNVLPTRNPVEHPLLDKVSAAYNGYRRSVLKKLSQVVETVKSDPGLRETVLGDGLSIMFSKTSSAEILSFDSMRYFLGAHLQDRSLLCNDAVAGAAVLDQDLFAEIHSA